MITNITAIGMATQIRQATSFMSGEQTGKDGRAVGVKQFGESVRITLDTGDTVTWKTGKDMATAVVAAFGQVEAYAKIAQYAVTGQTVQNA